MWYEGTLHEYNSPFIWASVPLYAAFDHAGLLVVPWLSGVALILMTAWLAWRARPDRWACLAPLIVGFSSPVLVYSLEFWEHTPGTALAVFALLGVIKATDSRRRALWLILSGAAIGLGLTMRAPDRIDDRR
jgi:4-amino-4-deoxy-L-arabinose transferase-like glycosyltransferase